MIRRLLLLQLLIPAGLCVTFLLPKAPDIMDSAVRLELPGYLIATGWSAGPKLSASERELQVLANDTNFARRNYYRRPPDDFSSDDSIQTLQASIVLSGKDLNNSLHRPERCLPAQGLNIVSSTPMEVRLGNGGVLPITKLHCTKTDPKTGVTFVYLNYYWFVGHDTVTNSHYGRTVRDMKDRLFRGYDQRWAYITVSTNLIDTMIKEEGTDRQLRLHSMPEADADKMIIDFIRELTPELLDTGAIGHWN